MTSEELEKALQDAFLIGQGYGYMVSRKDPRYWALAEELFWEYKQLVKTAKEHCNGTTSKQS